MRRGGILGLGGAALLAAWPGPGGAQTRPRAGEDAVAAARRLFSTGCGTGEAGDIVVCGRSESDRQRVPPSPRRPERGAGGAVVENEMANAFAPAGARHECGIFAGQRRCSKADMERSGWGGGRDPFTVARRIIGGPDSVVDPVPLAGSEPPR